MMRYILLIFIFITNCDIGRTSDRECKKLNGHCLFGSVCTGRDVIGKCCGPKERRCCMQPRRFVEYKCPLNIFTAAFGKCRSSSSEGSKGLKGIRNPIPQGIAHTFVELSKSMTCYDWGDWSYIRVQPCNDPSLKCCRADSSVVAMGTTTCTFEEIKAFNVKWKNDNGNYNFLCTNCQEYTEDFVAFLKSC